MTSNLEGLAGPPQPDTEGAPRRALVVAAHPDDADFGAAGTAHLWTQAGWPELISLRREEQRLAAAHLGVKDVFFLGNEDGELQPSRQLLGEVVRCIREVQPYAVFTHDPEALIVRDSFVNHSDHRATGVAAVDAVYPAARNRLNFPEQIAAGLPTHKVREIYIWGSERANFDVDITDVIERKVEALLLHKTQFNGEGFIRMALERWQTSEGRYVESFRRVQLSF